MQIGIVFSLTRFFFCPFFLAYYLHFAPFCLSSLVANSLFFMPKYPLLAPKPPLFNGCFDPFSHVFHRSKGFCLYNCCGFLCFFVLHLTAFWAAFITKTPCIKHQNGLRLASKRTPFSPKTHCVLNQNALRLAPISLKTGVNGSSLK